MKIDLERERELSIQRQAARDEEHQRELERKYTALDKMRWASHYLTPAEKRWG